MGNRVGILDLCTSHPGSWAPILRELGYPIVACWDSGDTRLRGFAESFAREHGIPLAAASPEEMIGKIDIVIIHSANWDKHTALARLFIDAGVAVLLDKPMAGNLRDANQLLDWAKQGKRMAGGSSLRFAKEVRAFLAEPVAERGVPHTVFAGCAADDFSYAIHAYSLLSGMMGPGIRSVRYLGASLQKHLQITWSDGRTGLLSIGKVAKWLPFHITAVTECLVRQITVTSDVYRAMLEATLPYLAGVAQQPPVPMEQLIEPELAALAARMSWLHGGAEVFLTDLRQDDPGYDGRQFAEEYRRSRLTA